MRRLFRRFLLFPIEQKVALVTTVATFSALLISSSLLFTYEIHRERSSLHQELFSIAEIMGGTCRPALEFKDEKAAELSLKALEADSRIIDAQVVDEVGNVFASYARIQDLTKNSWFSKLFRSYSEVRVSTNILSENTLIGRVNIHASAQYIQGRLLGYAALTLTVILLSLAVSFFLLRGIRRLLLRPLLRLTRTVQLIAEHHDYSLRAPVETNDEVGILVLRFNEMLDELSKNREQLEKMNQELETRVEQRSKELADSLEKLQNSERLASIGTLAAGLAHEIRNPLNSILLAAQLCKNSPEGTDEQFLLDCIIWESKRCSFIIKNVLLFAKSEKTSKEPSEINVVVLHSLDLARSYLLKNVPEIKVSLEEYLPKVLLNPTELEQVLINLITNSTEAGGNGTIIQVATRTDGPSVLITVADNGPGIEPDILPHIFDPFFSTKKRKGNTGLGLSLSHGIISEHGGTIEVKSTAGKGTIFFIRLPKFEEHEEAIAHSG